MLIIGVHLLALFLQHMDLNLGVYACIKVGLYILQVLISGAFWAMLNHRIALYIGSFRLLTKQNISKCHLAHYFNHFINSRLQPMRVAYWPIFNNYQFLILSPRFFVGIISRQNTPHNVLIHNIL